MKKQQKKKKHIIDLLLRLKVKFKDLIHLLDNHCSFLMMI
nr:MAG TPA: hypothetical protein [Caudoviricetes sp.]